MGGQAQLARAGGVGTAACVGVEQAQQTGHARASGQVLTSNRPALAIRLDYISITTSLFNKQQCSVYQVIPQDFPKAL